MKQFFYDEFRNDLKIAKDLFVEIFGQVNIRVVFSLVIFIFAISIFNTMGSSISYSTGYDSFYSMGNPHSLYFAYADLIKGEFNGFIIIALSLTFILPVVFFIVNLFKIELYAINLITVLYVALFFMLFNIVAATRVGQNNGGGISSAQGESILIYTFVEDLMSIRRHKGTEYQILLDHFIQRISIEGMSGNLFQMQLEPIVRTN